MAFHNSYLQLAKDIQARLEGQKVAFGLTDVFYGDQDKIPRTPAICVEPGDKTRNLNGLPRRTEVNMTVYLILYHYQLESIQVVREDNDTLAEQIEDFLHQDPQLRDNLGNATVIDSLVTRIESGYQQKRNSLFRASRMSFEARSQDQLPMSTP